jgi:hypothetical protein
MTGAVLALAVATVGTASASAEEIEFRGGGYINNFSNACAAKGFVDPVYVSSIYRPRRLGTNGDATRISFFFPQFYAASYELPKGRLGKSFKKVVGGATSSATYFFDNNPRMRIKVKTPRRVRSKTEAVTLSGTIRNFDGIDGCTADFDLSLRQQP